jgi:hypothetical protein
VIGSVAELAAELSWFSGVVGADVPVSRADAAR